MSESVKIPDLLKSTPEDSSLLGHSMLCATSSGELRRNTTAMPIPTTPICADANEAEEGFMRTDTKTVNLPVGGVGSYLLTLRYDMTAKMQVFFKWSPLRLYIRRRNSGGENSGLWDDWKQIAFVS